MGCESYSAFLAALWAQSPIASGLCAAMTTDQTSLALSYRTAMEKYPESELYLLTCIIGR